MSRPESERNPTFHIAPEIDERPAELLSLPLHFRKEAIEKFDREFRLEEKSARELRLATRSEASDADFSDCLVNAQSLMKRGEFQLAHNMYRSALRVDPGNELAVRGLAECAKAQFHHEEAVRILRELVEANASAENFKLLGDQLYEMEYNEDALESYLRALQGDSIDEVSLFDVYKKIGNILLRLGDPDGAEEYYNKAYTLDPDSDVLRVNFGSLAVYRGDYERALMRFREAVNLNDKNDKAWVGLAMIHREYGDSELAWANLEKALDVNPSNESAVRLVADWALKDGEIERGVQRLETYVMTHQDDAQMAMWLAKFLYFSGRLEAARLEIEKALCLEPELDGAIEVLSIIRAEQRDREAKQK